MFGHARGAFPGASGERAGLFEGGQGRHAPHRGRDEMPSALQAKLVRALDERKVRRMGEIREPSVRRPRDRGGDAEARRRGERRTLPRDLASGSAR